MTTQALTLTHPPVAILARPIDTYVNEATDAMRSAKAKRTLAAYASDWRLFVAWCERHDEAALPASIKTVVGYLGYMAQSKRVSTMQRALVSINLAHQADDQPSPTGSVWVREAMKGYRRIKGTRRVKKTALRKTDLKRIFSTVDDPDHPVEIRNRALLLVGFAGGFRRSELAALNAEDLQFTDEGVVITVRFSKTDQEGVGREVGICRGGALCPVKALQRWLANAGITTGCVFRVVRRSGEIVERAITPAYVATIVKKYAAQIGKDASDFAGHSLRSGFCTEAAAQGAGELEMMRSTGHKSVEMLREYIQAGTMFQSNASARLGL